MRRILAVITLLTLAGCGSGSSFELQTAEYDVELGKYRDEFLAVAKAQGRELPTNNLQVGAGKILREGGGEASGVCEITAFGATVVVDSNQWPQLTTIQKRGLMFHELGHCLLGRGHREDRMSELGCPVSLMAATLPIQSCFMLHSDEYDEELFRR